MHTLCLFNRDVVTGWVFYDGREEMYRVLTQIKGKLFSMPGPDMLIMRAVCWDAFRAPIDVKL
jgi:hypothetical protein